MRLAHLFGLWLLVVHGASAATPGAPESAIAESEAEAQAVADLLRGRWYEIEMVVFERLPVLDLNATEQLALRRPRSWPAELELLALDGGFVAPAVLNDMSWAADETHCIEPVPLPGAEQLVPEFSDRDLAEDVEQDPGTDQDESGQPVPPNSPRIEPTPQLDFLAELADFEEYLAQGSLQWLPTVTLNQAVKAINRRNHLRPVLHLRWRQALPERNDPQAIMVLSEDTPRTPATAEGFAKIEGHVAVTLGRYLHFAPTLWYHADGLGRVPLPVMGTPPPMLDADDRRVPYMELKASRRMRSGETHYIDHPKLGIVVRIDPIEIPQRLIDAHQALGDSGSQARDNL